MASPLNSSPKSAGNKSDIIAMIQAGDTCKSSGQLEEAITLYQRVLKIAPTAYVALHKLGEALAYKGDLPQAIAHYQRAIAINPSSHWSHYQLGFIRLQQNKYPAAIKSFRTATTLEPTSALFHSQLGHALYRNNNLNAAVKSLQQAIQLDPQHYATYLHLGAVTNQLGQLGQAIKHYRTAVSLNPTASWPHSALARLFTRRGNDKQAISHYKKAIQLNPDFAQGYVELGGLYKKKGDTQDEIQSYLKALEIDPTCEAAYTALQYLEVTSSQRQSIIHAYQKIAQTSPDAHQVWGNLGDALIQVGQPVKAIAAYQTRCKKYALQKRPDLSQITWKPRKELGPDYIIIGASKCGTSSLHKYIGEHPNVFLPHKKEINFFGNSNYDKHIDEYLAQFPSIADSSDCITGESSPGYFFLSKTDQRIHTLFPTVKLIVLLRNPVDRAISRYYHNANRGLESRSLETVIETEKARLQKMPEDKYATLGGALGESLYVYKLKRWMSTFPKEQFLILKSEDFYDKTASTMTEVFDFLQLPPHLSPHYLKYNVGLYQATDANLRANLADFFRPHNEKLSDYLDQDFSWNT